MAEPSLAYGMLGAAADSPRDRRLLRGSRGEPGGGQRGARMPPGDERPSLEEIMASPRVREALANPRIESGNVREGAGAEPGAPVTVVDKSVPSSAKAGGKTFDPRELVNVHEQVEEEAIRRLKEQGLTERKAYNIAHKEYALPAEKAAVEQAGIPWQSYQDKWRGYLSTTEHERGAQAPALDRAQAAAAAGRSPEWKRGSQPVPDVPQDGERAYHMLSFASEDPFERAALRTTRAVRPPGGRAYSPELESALSSIVPTTPADIGLTLALGPAGRAIGPAGRVGAAALGMMMQPSEAEAGPAAAVRRAAAAVPKILRPSSNVTPVGARAFEEAQKYLTDPVAARYPGIYKDPRQLATEAEAQVAPEHPALKQLFGVTRQDLYDISRGGTRAGNIDPMTLLNVPAKPGGSYMAENIMTPQNAQRLQDALAEARTRAPGLMQGMVPWYVMDPAYQRLVALRGPEEARRLYMRSNTLGSMASPASDVETEINRGTVANMMAERGQFGKFERYGGIPVAERGRGFPPEMSELIPHPYHPTAHAGPMSRYLESGDVDMGSVKVPLYIGASGVPETGFQTALPVPDAHFTRAIGMADVRKSAKPGVSMKMPEYLQSGPWFREQVAAPSGMEAVPAQALTWGLYGGQTGVDTLIGAPKLELLSKAIYERAQRLGIDPYMLRDKVLTGQQHAELEQSSQGAA